ncbi:MAG: M24 family metallopeptidase, partial [Acidimicrobiales bacterium]
PHSWDAYGYDAALEPGMVLSVEAYVGSRAGGEGVKLEEQVVITDSGYELLAHHPLEL